ncbi:MAG TPA: ABC transporter permease [Puia sp.]|nr:ABC transporter permease [Puia sp.]
MFKIHLRTGIRNLFRHRSFSLINLIGLALGLSAIMVLTVMLYQYLTTNGQFQHKERMYYVKSNVEGNELTQTPYPFLYEALRTCPDIEAGTHVQSWSWPWLKAGDKEFQDQTWFVDTGFFQVFSFPLEYGNPGTALRDKYSVVLGHEMAERLFGRIDPLGKTVTMDDSIPLKVTGVLQTIPSNTTLRAEVFLTAQLLNDQPGFLATADWYNTFAENYFMLRPGADTARLNTQLRQIAMTHYNQEARKAKPRLVPFTKFVQEESGNIVHVMIKGVIGTIFFILLIVVANLVNLNAATLFSRYKEVAVKKMMGSRRRHIVIQFCIENAILVAASLALAFLIFSSVLMPMMNEILKERFGSITLHMRRDYPVALVFISIGLIIVIIAGSYPAWHLGKLRAVDVIKGRLAGAGRSDKPYTRNIFITLQFVLAITFIGITLILHSQIRHMKSAALGFQKDNVLVANFKLSYKNEKAAAARFDALLNQLRSNPAVQGISTSEVVPTGYDNNYNQYADPITGKQISFRHVYTDAGLLPTYGVPIIRGRNFINSTPASDSLYMKDIIINRKAVGLMGWTLDNAVGRQLRAGGDPTLYKVVGVMEDFHYQDLTRDVEPLMHHYAGATQMGYTYLSIRTVPGGEKGVQRQLEAAFKEMPARRNLQLEYMSDRVDHQYALLEGILKTTNYVALLTIFIAAMGLFGLIALFTRQRVKEIGIRKVLGASPASIVRLLSRNFIMLVGLALLIASPLAWMIMHKWLEDFAYRVEIQWWMLGGAGLIALSIALVTVAFHAIRAALANPVESLRSE